MKQDQLRAWQPDQFDRFVRILEQDQLNHAYLFSSSHRNILLLPELLSPE